MPVLQPAPVTPHVATKHRVFSAEANMLADQWSQYAVAPIIWAMDPSTQALPGAEGGFWVTSPPWRGYAKPLAVNSANPKQRPTAACEKIASDLAYELELPVPPVTLFERTNVPAGQARHHCVSAPPFPTLHRWDVTRANRSIMGAIRACAAPAMSAMVAFDTWLECEDHKNHPGNLLVTTGAGATPEIHLAWIDYAASLTNAWRVRGCESSYAAPMYDPAVEADIATMSETIDAIRAIPDDTIQRIVARIPDTFLSQNDRYLIVRGLRYRRDHLRSILGCMYPGVQ
jgi:hypothetical protein